MVDLHTVPHLRKIIIIISDIILTDFIVKKIFRSFILLLICTILIYPEYINKLFFYKDFLWAISDS